MCEWRKPLALVSRTGLAPRRPQRIPCNSDLEVLASLSWPPVCIPKPSSSFSHLAKTGSTWSDDTEKHSSKSQIDSLAVHVCAPAWKTHKDSALRRLDADPCSALTGSWPWPPLEYNTEVSVVPSSFRKHPETASVLLGAPICYCWQVVPCLRPELETPKHTHPVLSIR